MSGALGWSQSLFPNKYNNQIQLGLKALLAHNYLEAKKIWSQGTPSLDQGTILYLEGLLYLGRYNDLGDTAALSVAKSRFQKLVEIQQAPLPADLGRASPAVLTGLAHLQMSFVSSVQGSFIQAALQANKGKSYLKKNTNNLEAQASLLTLSYYQGRLLQPLKWIPLVRPGDTEAKKSLAGLPLDSSVLSDFFYSSLMWMHYDAQEFDFALALAQKLHHRHPLNRTFKEFLADCHFRLGNYIITDSIYTSLIPEYRLAQATHQCSHCLPLAQLAAVGNLIKCSRVLKQKSREQELLKTWNDPANQKLKPYLASSLVKEVDKK